MAEHDRELRDNLRDLGHMLDEVKRAEWDRSLPLPDLIGDRWERAQRLGFEQGASIYDSALVLGRVEVGPDTWVGPYTILDGSGGGLRIGAWCTVSAGCQIYTHDTVRRSLSGGQVDRHVGPVTIGDRSYLGPQAVVTAGVEIGPMSVVAAQSMVNRAVPERTVVGGCPAKPIGRVVGDGPDTRIEMG